MAHFEVYATESFQREYRTLTKDESEWVQSIKKQLESNVTGKPLHFNWFREKKYRDKRLYFLVDESSGKILFMAFAPKKGQQKIIDFIIQHQVELLEGLRKL